MIWNYRVFRESDDEYVIREVFYSDEGTILACAAQPAELFGQSTDELGRVLEDFQAALQLPVLTLDDIPPPEQRTPSPERPPSVRQGDIRAALGLDDGTASRKGAGK